MAVFLEILKFTLPALIVFFTSWLIIRSFVLKDQKLRQIEYKINNQKQITPVRLVAYERLALFLERISPDQLLLRVHSPSMDVETYREALIMTIRAEFEHNISQQIYVTPQLWHLIKNSKENMIRMINITSNSLSPRDASFELSKRIMETIMASENSPVELALSYLKKEVAEML